LGYIFPASGRLSLQKLSQLEGVGRCGALLIVIEIDVDVVPPLLPGTDPSAPVVQRGRSIVPLVAATGAVAPDVDEIGGSLPGAGTS
jgi:hypothetical protein